jgi:CP family cyanate transporter-like MFS transporter
VAITIGNVAVPVLIGRDFAADAGLVTAMYVSALNIGAMATSLLSAPLAGIIGWRAALIAWGALAVGGLALWTRAAAVSRRRASADAARVAATAPRVCSTRPPVTLWRRPFVWGLTLAFGSQAFGYYGVSAWLPTLLHDEIGLGRSTAGASASIFQVLAVAGAFGVPALLHRGLGSSSVLLIVCGLWITLPVGLLIAPSAWPLWCALGGTAQGGGFTAIFTVVVHRALDQRDGRRISATVQAGGYTLAATGPFLIGAARDVSGGWTAPLLLVCAAVAVMAAAGAAAGRRPPPPHCDLTGCESERLRPDQLRPTKRRQAAATGTRAGPRVGSHSGAGGTAASGACRCPPVETGAPTPGSPWGPRSRGSPQPPSRCRTGRARRCRP